MEMLQIFELTLDDCTAAFISTHPVAEVIDNVDDNSMHYICFSRVPFH